MDQQQKEQAQFSGAYLLVALAALLIVLEKMTRRLLEIETLDRTDIETLVSAPAVAAAKA